MVKEIQLPPVPQEFIEAYREFSQLLSREEKNKLLKIPRDGFGTIPQGRLLEHLQRGDSAGILFANFFLESAEIELKQEGNFNPSGQELIDFLVKECRRAVLERK